MKTLFAALVAAFVGTAFAQSSHDAHQHAVAEQAHQASGVVKSVNADKGVVTIAHEPVASLKWPAMTMGFKARDAKLLQAMKPGQKVTFEFVQQGKDYVIISLR